MTLRTSNAAVNLLYASETAKRAIQARLAASGSAAAPPPRAVPSPSRRTPAYPVTPTRRRAADLLSDSDSDNEHSHTSRGTGGSVGTPALVDVVCEALPRSKAVTSKQRVVRAKLRIANALSYCCSRFRLQTSMADSGVTPVPRRGSAAAGGRKGGAAARPSSSPSSGRVTGVVLWTR